MQDKIIPKEVLMPQTYDPREVWQISVGKEVFKINGKQAQVLKDASIAGQRGLIFFDGFAVSIAHISFIERIKSLDDILEDEKHNQKIEEMKKQFGG